MRCILVVTAVALVGLAPRQCFCQAAEDRITQVDPQPGEDIQQACEYRLALPSDPGPFRAVWVIFDRGLDFTEFYRSRQARAFAVSRRLALILAMHCRSKEIEDMDVDPGRGIGRALFTALDQFADSEARPELRSAPLVAMGWSGAGSLVARLAAYRPERYLAGIAYEPGQYDPLGMNTIELHGRAIGKPQLIITGGADDHVGTERPYRYFRKYFDMGAPWTFVIQNRTPHCCLQNAQTLILDWLDDVLAMKPDEFRKGLFGYVTVEYSQIKDGWHNATFNAAAARVGREACQPKKNEFCAGWLPSSKFAENWLQFVRRQAPLATWTP
jgi:dienelactone hydrolase